MKEIDFLPEWYKSGRRRQVSHRSQYIALGGVFVAMVVWNFVAAHSISKAQAELAHLETQAADAKSASVEFADIEVEISKLQEKAKSIENIDSRIDVAGVLAELSYLIDERIALSKVEFIAEKFSDEKASKAKSSSAVRMLQKGFGSQEAVPLGDVRFKVLISGVAADASDVAKLICKLEDSQYFCQVIPLFSRNREIKPGRMEEMQEAKRGIWETGGENNQVSEFEVSCYLANYRQEGEINLR